MRVLLVQAFTALDLELVYPIGLAYLAAHLPASHVVEIFDVNLHRDLPDPYRPLADKLRAFRPDVVGISLRNIKVATPGVHADDFEPQQRTVQLIRREAPQARIVAGGTAFSLYAEIFMRKLPELDVGLWGEGEDRFPQLLEALDAPWTVPGVWYRKDGAPTYTGAPPPVDFAGLRHYRKDLVPFQPYLDSSFVSVGLQTKRGCALHCIHCSDTYLLGNAVRRRDPADIVDEMELLYHQHGVRQMFFCDQIFNIPVQHAIDICRTIVDRGLEMRWSAWFNEKANTLPDELLGWLKRAGCGLLSFSPDHVDDRMLRNLDKNFRYKDLVYTYQAAKRFDLDVEYSFFLNAPGEDWRSLGNLLKFIAEARLHCGSNFRLFTLLMMQPIRIYPHSRLHELAVETGLVDKDADLIEGQFWNPGGLQYAVAGIQATAQGLYRARRRYKQLTRQGPATV
ncbi:MAG: cobalamin B12-binding domain-containing protein [Alphaproteobacteria bacterium]|nr:cobalamin B12-binding domain-containing protein [Alphaproteobacteria bacterium]